MRINLSLLIFIVFCVNFCDFRFVRLKRGECKAFREFMTRYNITYKSHHEYKKRKLIFIKNYRQITSHNRLYRDKRVSFNCSINRYTDMSSQEFQGKFTGFKSNIEFEGVKKVNFGGGAMKNEEGFKRNEVDWRDTAVTSVKRQGLCGSCWAFSAAGALEGQIAIKTGYLANISVQIFLDCVKTEITQGCDGGLMTDAFTLAMTHGVVNDKFRPYEGAESEKCLSKYPKIPVNVDGFVEIKNATENELERIVREVGPVSVAIDASWLSMQFYDHGVYFDSRCSVENVNHAVLIVGFGVDEVFGDYWIVKNSWGKSWGSNGYLKLARNKDNHCGVTSFPSYPIISNKFFSSNKRFFY